VGGGSSHEAHVPLPHHAHPFRDSSSWPRVRWCWSGHGFVHGGGTEELLSIESLVSLEEFWRDGPSVEVKLCTSYFPIQKVELLS
jgi:hypothetical protein